MIAHANPQQLSEQAQHFRKAYNDYRASSPSRFTRKMVVPTQGAGADYHIRDVARFYYLTEVARDIDMNDMVVGQGIDRFCVNILQGGFDVEPDTGVKGANALIKKKWQDWSDNPQQCDVQGEFDFPTLSWFALRDSIVAGDICGLPLLEGQIQLVESHRLRTPRGGQVNDRKIIHGVEVDANRRRLGYWFTRDEIPINRLVRFQESVRYPAYDDVGNKQVFHVWHPKRSTQTRGVTKLAPAVEASVMHDDIQFARLSQQQSVSAYSWVRERKIGCELPAGTPTETRQEQDPCSGAVRPVKTLSLGAMYTTFPGEEMKAVSANVPNPTFFDHARMVQQIIALNLDQPLILFLLDSSETNFSGWRGSMDQARIKFKHFQKWFACCAWYRHVYRWKLRQLSTPGSPQADRALMRVRESVGDERFFAHTWIYPTWPYIQPEIEQRADVEALGNCLISPRHYQMSRGRDWNLVYPQIIDDRGDAIEAAIERANQINTRFPDNPSPINWTHLISFPQAFGATRSGMLEEQEKEEPASAGLQQKAK